ncbi:MAG: hypothetical protein ACJ74Y_06935, partial [Bryobacteraceae bacterium]
MQILPAYQDAFVIANAGKRAVRPRQDSKRATSLGSDDAVQIPPAGYTSHDTIIVAGEASRWLSLRTGTNGLELTLNNQAFVHGFSNALVH